MPYLLGLNSDTAWVFYYELEAATCLDLDFLGTLKLGKNKPETAIIYADKCLLSKKFMAEHGVIFKKIPRVDNKVFVDTSFFIALMNSRDADHAMAVKFQQRLSLQATKKITSDYILLELCDGLAKLHYREFALQLIGLLQQDQSFEIVPASSEITQTAWELFTARSDKEWGLTDCISFVIM
jgi:uncharacterized protein